MTDDTADAAVLDVITEYVRTALFSEPDAGPLDPSTPLVESGLLSSLQTARLLSFLEREFGVRVPPTDLVRRNFENLQRITDLVVSLRAHVH
jgi:acyl carrier protein